MTKLLGHPASVSNPVTSPVFPSTPSLTDPERGVFGGTSPLLGVGDDRYPDSPLNGLCERNRARMAMQAKRMAQR